MSLKFIVVTILCQLVISEQKTIEKIALDTAQIEELNNLLTELELQINKEHKIHQHLEKQKDKAILEGNDVLSLLLQRNHDDKDRSDEGVLKYKNDRDCKSGRCGCSRGRCGNNRAESSSDEVTKLLDSLEKTIDRDGGYDHTRCGRGRCGHDRDGKSNDIRCQGGRCGKNKDDLDNRDDEPSLRASRDIKQELEKYGKTYKLNNQLDVVVLNAENVGNTVKELNKKCSKYANCKVLDYSKARSLRFNEEKDDLNAVILDLTHLLDGNTLAKDLNNALTKSDDSQRDHLSPEDLDRYYQNYKKTAFNDVVRYVKDKSGRRVLSVKYLSGKQKQLIEDVKTLLLKGGIGLNDKKVVKQIEKILFGKDSSMKIYPHVEHNRNIYVPKYLYERIEKSKSQSNLRVHKRILPLTLKQRHRLLKSPVHSLRRKSDPGEYGVPFELQVQGLGQAVP
ncbi:uncharacterized protein LOC115448774 [Manduca sexta]|uniref:Uncharacterized protein n=1 Tax=Manduca sexta TaxID=7130 RepID=A0A921ZJU2_MANSE|nr:uncharacterized protein LOC115448774 [Manduca sexta]KAG6458364.1 hypothetical protein O3G_MSEX010817 [Manduca sexta]